MKNSLVGVSVVLLVMSCGRPQVQGGLGATVCIEASCDLNDESFRDFSINGRGEVWNFDGLLVDQEENGRFTLEGNDFDVDFHFSSAGEWDPDLLTSGLPNAESTVRVSSFRTGGWSSGLTVEVMLDGDSGFPIWAAQMGGSPSRLHESLVQGSPNQVGGDWACASTSSLHALGSTDGSTELGTNSSGALIVGSEEIEVQHFHSRSGSKSVLCEDGDEATASFFVARKTRTAQ